MSLKEEKMQHLIVGDADSILIDSTNNVVKFCRKRMGWYFINGSTYECY